MLEEISNFFLSGNNEIFALILSLGLGIIPLMLIWRSTRVRDRPYNQYVTFRPDNTGIIVGSHEIFQTATNNVAASFDQETSDSDIVSEGEAANSSNNASQTANEDNQYSTQEDGQPTAQTEDATSETEIPSLLPGHFYIRLKFLDETVKVVQAKPTDTIREFRRKTFPRETADRYRIIFRGQVLRNNEQTIEQCGIICSNNSSSPTSEIPVVHCFLSRDTERGNRPHDAASQLQNTVEDLNIGHFFLPLLGSILAWLWYLCIYHTTLFTLPSIFGIIGLSCFYLVLVVNRFL